ncbi:2-dehydro-3-deoxyphosphogluconate aldolase/(4S)-4-hydroxy-2-oxoglutarate aldolase [Sinobaca qinghaiensis]|uniref:2-dehydro-3-deoxyphosphogluconate aldolase/(4S)-4-hydroxy-2-oxoglutarate aldolase n=1 Tax=Sinobaca qinghaiensis TaxID=342944 RepID=A0A419V8Z0_9BACL|nr:bifunctional 2-keto-4-hydroxyglutarate aldolase/2-keto-3-deoxy-6-phosphogluconate aldolase [Sinobaca qinghaiensis]RKD76389.1 2-dehydro-3-deoxyphosphogluconate aldolase/(4S)-4-hydroxy-2-oxoglutarate aldolase [Sinobaca qinghaiensis]
MAGKLETLQMMIDKKAVAVVRGSSVEEAEMVAEGSLKGGISILEITYTVPGASSLISSLIKNHPDKAVVGAGTVLDEVTARIAILAGAAFIVSPSFNKETALLCNRYSIPYIPGCYTVKEVIEALEYGSDIIKIFPGNTVSPSFISTINGPVPQAKLMPSGGVNAENAKEWINKGAAAISIGSSLYKSTVEEVEAEARKVTESIQGIK